jgi:hypothetical protein
MTNDEDPLAQRAAWVQSNLEERHGKEATSALIGAIGQVGVDQGALRRLIAGQDAINDMEQLGLEATLRVMQQGRPSDSAVRDAEAVYTTIRQRQREEWRMGRGRR